MCLIQTILDKKLNNEKSKRIAHKYLYCNFLNLHINVCKQNREYLIVLIIIRCYTTIFMQINIDFERNYNKSVFCIIKSKKFVLSVGPGTCKY